MCHAQEVIAVSAVRGGVAGRGGGGGRRGRGGQGERATGDGQRAMGDGRWCNDSFVSPCPRRPVSLFAHRQMIAQRPRTVPALGRYSTLLPPPPPSSPCLADRRWKKRVRRPPSARPRLKWHAISRQDIANRASLTPSFRILDLGTVNIPRGQPVSSSQHLKRALAVSARSCTLLVCGDAIPTLTHPHFCWDRVVVEAWDSPNLCQRKEKVVSRWTA